MKIQLPWKEQRSSSTDIASPRWPHSKGTKGMESDFSPWAIPFQQPGDTGTFVYLTYTGQDSWAKSKVEKGGEYILRDKGRNPAQWGIICYDYSTTLDINPKAMFYFSSPKLCFNSVMKSCQLSLSRFHHIHLLITRSIAFVHAYIWGRNLWLWVAEISSNWPKQQKKLAGSSTENSRKIMSSAMVGFTRWNISLWLSLSFSPLRVIFPKLCFMLLSTIWVGSLPMGGIQYLMATMNLDPGSQWQKESWCSIPVYIHIHIQQHERLYSEIPS